jgi:hypothetical protein
MKIKGRILRINRAYFGMIIFVLNQEQYIKKYNKNI